jgi:acyl-CoA synthetase (AMP-forming)/AMP-acid ligase II
VSGGVSLASLLFEHPFAPDEPLLSGDERVMTVAEAQREAERVATGLRVAGCDPGTAVTVQLPDGPELVTAMFGIWRAGCVYVPVNVRYPPPEVQRIVQATQPRFDVQDRCAVHEHVGGEWRIYPEDTAFVMWTSGTTGAPKPILHTHSAYFELLDRVLGPLGGGRRDVTKRPTPTLIPVSLSLNAGIYNALFGLRAGSALVIMDGFDTVRFAALVREHAIRSTVLPPAAMTMLADDERVADLHPLRYVRSITAPLSPVQARRFAERFGVTVLNGYGQAEIGEVIGWTAADAREHPEKVGAAGRAHPGVELRLADETGAPVAAGETGRLLVRPPRMAAGYASGSDLGDRVDGEGFVDTGDLARVDEDGFVWIEGRASDVINRGGNKVFPEHVAEVLRLLPGVADAGVVGIADERLGAVPVALVVADPSVTDDALRAICRAHLAPYKVPVAFHRVERLPRNDAGKVDRRELVALHERVAAGS